MRAAIRRVTTGSSLFVVAAILSVATAAAMLAFLHAQARPTVDAPPVANSAAPAGAAVLVARTDIPAGTTLTAAMLESRPLAASDLVSGAISDVSKATGRVTLYPLVRNEQISDSKLAGSSAVGQGLAFSIPQDMRAVSIPISAVTTAGGLIVPGDRVDVMVATTQEQLSGTQQPADPTKSGPVVITVLQDVLVLAIAQETTPPIQPQQDPATLRADNAKPQPAAGTATVAVTPDQAQLLFLSQQHGTLGLALRPYGQDNVVSLTPRNRIESLSQPGALAQNR